MPTLYVQLERGHGLENASDPCIVLRAGQNQHQTLAGNGPGPASFQTNRFTFPLGETDYFFDLEAWSAGASGAAALGKTVLDLRQLQPEHWQRKKEALAGPAENIEIEFELYLSMANVQEQAPGGSLSFSSQENEHYRHIVSLIDTEGTDLISDAACVSFLSDSGLPEPVLAEIWRIAWRINDTNFLTADIAEIWQKYGFLTVEAFFVALRLVAHAQTHSQPSLELAMVSPPALPEFRGLQQHHAQSQPSPEPAVAVTSFKWPAVIRPPASPETQDLQQHRAVVEQQSPRGCSVAVSSQRAASDVIGAVTDYEWQPVIGGCPDPPQGQPQASASSCSSGTNRRRPFNIQDWFPTACEKKEYVSLFRTCDANSDGFVQWDEAQVLLGRSGLDSNLLSLAWEHADQDKDGRLTLKEFVILVHLVTCTLKGAQLPNAADGLPQELLQAVDEMVLQEGASSVMPSNAHQQEAAVVADDGLETAAMASTANAFDDVAVFGYASAEFDDAFAKQKEEVNELHDFPANAITAVTAHLEASTGLDKYLVLQLQHDVADLEEELQSVQQSQNEQVARAEHERELQQRQASMVTELERDLQDTKKQLHQLRERRDHFLINSEINFLNKMLDEEERSLEEVLRVSRIIEKSWKDVRAGTEAIEGQRKLIQRQVAAEEELLRLAKWQNAEMTTRVERQQVAVGTESHEEHAREKRLRDINAGTAADSAPKRLRNIKAGTAADAAPKTGRQASWHGDHATPHLTTAFTSRCDVGRPIFHTAVLVGGREGV